MSKRHHKRRAGRIVVRSSETVGAPPGALRDRADSERPSMQLFSFDSGAFEERFLDTPDQISGWLGKRAVTWLHVDGVGDAAAIHAIGERFHCHPLALEDTINAHQRSKVEDYGHQVYVVVRAVLLEERLAAEQVSLFIGKDYLLSFSENPAPDKFMDPVRERIRTSKGRVRRMGADYLAYAVLDCVIDHYFPILEEYGERLEGIEDRIMSATGPDALGEIQAIKSDLLVLRRYLWPLREAIHQLVRDPIPWIKEETRIFLRDAHDHCIRLMETLEFYREMADALMALYLSMLSARSNDVMRVLTIIATIFIPLSFIAGVYGMNFDTSKSAWNMPELGWAYGYPMALGIMGGTTAIFLVYFVRKGWLLSGWRARRNELASAANGDSKANR